MLKKTFILILVALLNYGCWPNGQSRRNQCKRGIGYGYIDNALGQRNTMCSLFLLQLSETPNSRNSEMQKPTLALCVMSQNYLNECENETTLPLGTGDIK